MARALRAMGHEVTVLTTNASGTLPTDPPWVIRTGDLQASPALRRVLGRPAPDGGLRGGLLRAQLARGRRARAAADFHPRSRAGQLGADVAPIRSFAPRVA